MFSSGGCGDFKEFGGAGKNFSKQAKIYILMIVTFCQWCCVDVFFKGVLDDVVG